MRRGVFLLDMMGLGRRFSCLWASAVGGTRVSVTFSVQFVCESLINWPRGFRPRREPERAYQILLNLTGGRGSQTRSANHRPPTDTALRSLAVLRHRWAVTICKYKSRNPLFGWKIPQRWRNGGPLTAGRQWQPNPPMLCSGMLSSWLNAAFTTQNVEKRAWARGTRKGR